MSLMRVAVAGMLLGAGVTMTMLCGCANQAPAGSARGAAPEAPGAATSPHFRGAAPRSLETIFSPLSLPAPNDWRAASGVPGHAYWQQRVDYVIDAALDERTQELSGTARITYTNNSPDRLEFLWICLEQNLFRPDSLGSLMRENEGRFSNRNPFVGGVNVTSCKVAGQETRLAVHDTMGRIDLPTALAPRGGQVELEIAWTCAVPSYGADRLGIFESDSGPVYQVAQWFPAMAVYDDVNGWNTLPYLGQGEFYTNFGDYAVNLTVPRSHIVAATGELLNAPEVLTQTQQQRLAEAMRSPEPVVIRAGGEVDDPSSRPPGEGPLTWKFRAKAVRTFAFTCSPAFLWDAAYLDWGDGTGCLCQSVYPPEAQPLWGDKSTRMLKFSIEHYSKMWYRYPYPVATNVNGIVGGMEYPMIIFCAERRDERGLYGVTTHEIGHNWFPMTVSNDERRHAWMDEGFNTFINYYAVKAYYPEARPHRGDARDFVPAMREADQQPIMTPADQILPYRLGTLEYAKTAVGLVLLRDYILGPDRFDPAFRHYVRSWAFKSPMPADFFRCIENGAGMDLAWFWRGWFMETGTLDQAVETVRHEMNGPKVSVTFLNRGRLVMPVKYRVTYSDGSQEMRGFPVEAWFTHDRFVATWDAGGKRVRKVEIDPEGYLPDTDLGNNVWGPD